MEQPITPLEPGTPAPAFSLPRSQHARFLLSDAAHRPLVLVFYPGDWEPVSEAQLSLYEANFGTIQRGGAMLAAISTDSLWSHARFARCLDLNYPLLSDAEPLGAVARRYGVFREAASLTARALFVIDEQGIIRWRRDYPMNVNPGLGGILNALEAIGCGRV